MKKCDLQKIYAELASKLPIREGYDRIDFTSNNLPAAPSEMETENLYILKRGHAYNDFYVESAQFYAHKETYAYLGLLILSVVFQPQISEVKLKLNHPHSEIETLIIKDYFTGEINELAGGFHSRPFAFIYYPETAYLHPFQRFGCGIDPKDLPCFNIVGKDRFRVWKSLDEDWANRNEVELFGSHSALVLFAELLLNASLPQSEQTKFALESESGGYRGVGVSSAEAVLFLPGNLAWFDEHWKKGK